MFRTFDPPFDTPDTRDHFGVYTRSFNFIKFQLRSSFLFSESQERSFNNDFSYKICQLPYGSHVFPHTHTRITHKNTYDITLLDIYKHTTK